MPLRIGFDISQTGLQKTGCGYFAASTLQHLAKIDRQNTYIPYPTFGDTYWDPEGATDTVRVQQPDFNISTAPFSLPQTKEFWDKPLKNFETKLGNPDIIHANNFFCPAGLRHAKLVYTFYDFNFVENPEWWPAETWTACFDGTFSASLHADRIAAISEASRRHFLKIFPHYPENQTTVIYPASRFEFKPDLQQPESLSLLAPGQFWFNAGTLEPRKNQIRIIRAYHRLKQYLGDSLPLVLAGKNGGDLPIIQQLIRDLRIEDEVLLLNYVKDEELRWLYQNCFAFVFPSLFEGFGMPLLEAMSLGAPVISSTNSCIPEITGEAALLVDASKEEEITEAMMRLALGKIKRENLRDKGFRRAAQFSWEKAARETLALYSSIIS